MSSNPNSNVRGRVKSIRHRIAGQRVRLKIGMHFWHCLFLLIMMVLVWLAAREYMAETTVPFFDRIHHFSISPMVEKADNFAELRSALRTLRYTVVSKATGAVIVDELIFAPVLVMAMFSGALFLLEMTGDLLSYSHEKRRIKKELAPLDEIAMRAEEISQIELSEDKYHLIEEKITSLEPTEEAKLSFGDEDLRGIERAMNSLLTRIRESNRQQARFVNDASHELRTPIAVIEGYANMLARWGREDEKVLDESISAIQNESAHMKHLVEQLLFLARGDAGRTVLKKEKIDLC